jgi:hypothetical protein
VANNGYSAWIVEGGVTWNAAVEKRLVDLFVISVANSSVQLALVI